MATTDSLDGMATETVDGHDTEHHHHDSLHDFEMITSSFSVFISMFICFGNTMTIVAVLRNHRLKTTTNLYIASLAVADVLVGVMLFVQTICFVSSQGQVLKKEKYLCLSLMSMLFVSVAASMFSSFLVACDRYIYIMYSIRYSCLVTKEKSLKAICVMWALAIFYGSVPLYTSYFTEGEGCTPTHIFSPVYMIIIHPITFFSVLISTFWLYFRIGQVAIRQSRQIRNQLSSTEPGFQRPITKRTWKAVKILILVFGLFCLSWCPLLIIAVLEYTVHVTHDALSIASLLGILNSGMNFLVLTVMNRDFRTEFKRILLVCFCCRITKIAPLDTPVVSISTNIE